MKEVSQDLFPPRDSVIENIRGTWECLCNAVSSVDILSGWSKRADPVSLVPFDGDGILWGYDAVTAHMCRRAGLWSPIQIQWTLIGQWHLSDTRLIVVNQCLKSRSPDGITRERRHVLVSVAEIEGGSIRFRHVSEAAPAVLPLIIANYKRAALAASKSW